MKRSVIVVLISFLAFILFASLFGFNTIGMATLFIQQQGNVVNYKIDKAGDFVQCMDAEPSNDIFKQGICHTQLRKGDEIYGIISADSCKSENEVVDYYCSASLVCTETVKECPENYGCEDGRCVMKLKPYRYFDIRSFGKKFRNLLIR